MDGASSNPALPSDMNQLNRQCVPDATTRRFVCQCVMSVGEKEEDNLSVETALENGQWWEDDWFWEKYAQVLAEKEEEEA